MWVTINLHQISVALLEKINVNLEKISSGSLCLLFLFDISPSLLHILLSSLNCLLPPFFITQESARVREREGESFIIWISWENPLVDQIRFYLESRFLTIWSVTLSLFLRQFKYEFGEFHVIFQCAIALHFSFRI